MNRSKNHHIALFLLALFASLLIGDLVFHHHHHGHHHSVCSDISEQSCHCDGGRLHEVCYSCLNDDIIHDQNVLVKKAQEDIDPMLSSKKVVFPVLKDFKRIFDHPNEIPLELLYLSTTQLRAPPFNS